MYLQYYIKLPFFVLDLKNKLLFKYINVQKIFFLCHQNYLRILCTPFYFYVFIFYFLQMKSTTVLYRYNNISRDGFYKPNIRHAAITGAIYTLVSTNKNTYLWGFMRTKIYIKMLNVPFFIAKVRCTQIQKKKYLKSPQYLFN